MTNQIHTKKNDFIELKYTGYANNEIFDSNVEEDLKKLNPKAKTEKFIIVIGQEMTLKSLDKELENKELNKDYEINIKSLLKLRKILNLLSEYIMKNSNNF